MSVPLPRRDSIRSHRPASGSRRTPMLLMEESPHHLRQGISPERFPTPFVPPNGAPKVLGRSTLDQPFFDNSPYGNSTVVPPRTLAGVQATRVQAREARRGAAERPETRKKGLAGRSRPAPDAACAYRCRRDRRGVKTSALAMMPVSTTSSTAQEELPGAELWPPSVSVGGSVGVPVAPPTLSSGVGVGVGIAASGVGVGSPASGLASASGSASASGRRRRTSASGVGVGRMPLASASGSGRRRLRTRA